MQPGVHRLTPLLYTRRRNGKNPPATTTLLRESSSKRLLLSESSMELPPEPDGQVRIDTAATTKVDGDSQAFPAQNNATDVLFPARKSQPLVNSASTPALLSSKVVLAPLDTPTKIAGFEAAEESKTSTPSRRFSACDSPANGDAPFLRRGTFELQMRISRNRRASQQHEDEREPPRPNTALGNEVPSLATGRLTDPLSLSTFSLPTRPNTSMGFTRSGDLSRTLSLSSEKPIISSWNPRNFQLHWHQDLTEQAPDVLPSWIWQRQNLRVLLVGGNRLQSIPSEIGTLQNLNEFVAFNNRLTEIPPELFTLAKLQKLDLSFNYLLSVPDQIVELTQLREIKLGHNRLTRIPDVIVNVGMMHVELLDVSHNRLTELPRHLHNVNTLQFLDVSHNKISSLPLQFRLLERLEMLDVSYNCLEGLPINELKLMLCGLNGREARLNCIECRGNPLLTRPPPEINEQGGRSVALYLRESVRSEEELENTDMVMVVYGDRGAGKTSMVQALSARSNRSKPIRRLAASHGVEFSTWSANPDLGFQVIELTAGTALSSNMLQLFLVRRSIYVWVWAPRECLDGVLPEWEALHLKQSVNNWIDAIQHAVPGASILFVATHVDQVNEAELCYQSDLIQRTAQARLERHRRSMEKRELSRQMPILKIFKDCQSLRVDSLKGTGVVDLRSAVIAFTKSTPWYRESIPTSYMCLRDALSKLAKNGRKVWMSWREYRDLAYRSGIKGHDHLRICTVFLNDIGILRFFGDVDKAQAAEKQPPNERLEVLNSVYISLEWVVDVMKGLFQSDRGALLDFFSRGRYKDKHMYLRVRRLLTRGVVHPTLAAFLWPLVPEWPHAKDEAIQAWWEEARAQGLYEDKLICSDEAGLRRVLHLVEGLDIGAITQEDGQLSKSLGGQEEWLVPPLVVPGLLSEQHRLPLDGRVFSDDCLYRIDVEYLTLPPGFFNKLLVSLRRQADHIDFNTRAAALYAMGTKLQVFMARKEGDPQSSSCVTALFSSTQVNTLLSLSMWTGTQSQSVFFRIEGCTHMQGQQLWEPFKNVLSAVERLFPGLHRVAFNYRIFADIHDSEEGSEDLDMCSPHSSTSQTSSFHQAHTDPLNASLGSESGGAGVQPPQSLSSAGPEPLSPHLPSPTHKAGSPAGRSRQRRRSSQSPDRGSSERRGSHHSPDRRGSEHGVGALQVEDSRRNLGKSKAVDGLGRSVSAGHAKALLEAGIADRRGSTTLETPLLNLEMSLDREDVMKAKARALEHTIGLLYNPIQVLVLHSSSSTNVGIAAVTAIKALDPTLEVQRRTPADDPDPNNRPLLMVLLVDREIARNPKGIQQVRAHIDSKRSIIPMLAPSYEHGSKRWWPDSMPELERFSPCEDVRFREEWADLEWKDSRQQYYKLRPQMLEQLHRLAHTGDSWAMKERLYALGEQQKKEAEMRKDRMKKVHLRARTILRDWRGEPPSANAVDHSTGIQQIPCIECIRTGEEKPANFSRSECVRVLEEANPKNEVGPESSDDSLLLGSNPWRVHRPANTKVIPWVTCAFGHLLGAAEVLESASRGVYDSVTCPSCMRHGTAPPGSFNRHECLAFFRGAVDSFPGLLMDPEPPLGAQGAWASRRMSQAAGEEAALPVPMSSSERAVAGLRCPKCLAKGLPGPKLLDVLAPEVFLSYSPGREMRDDGGAPYSANAKLVTEMREYIEDAADVLCWMDEGAGRTSDPDQVEIGIDKAVVVVAFLSDQYVRSETCRRELHRALIKGKYILPVLVSPIDVLDEGGWSGEEEGEKWWQHAKQILSGGAKSSAEDALFKSARTFVSRTLSQPPTRTGSADSSESAHAANAMEVDWEGLAGYAPVDLRSVEREAAEQDIAKRILGRFHRATQVKKQTERARQVWRRIKMVKSFWAADPSSSRAASAFG